MSDDLVGRYRRLYVRIWDDPKFRRLSPTEQRVALYLLTGPQSNRIGLYKFSAATAADDLSLGIETTRKAFETVVARFEWQFDPDARVIYLPNWWRWNTSVNTNIMVGNLKDLSELPSCGLVESFASNTAYIPPKLHESFRKALGERFPKLPRSFPEHSPTSGTGTGTGAGTGAGTYSALPRGAKASPKLPATSLTKSSNNGTGLREGFDRFWAIYPKKEGKQEALKVWKKLKPSPELTERMLETIDRQRRDDDWVKDRGKWVPQPAKWLRHGRWDDEPASLPLMSARTIALARAGKEFLES